jgi:hypothetical protein
MLSSLKLRSEMLNHFSSAGMTLRSINKRILPVPAGTTAPSELDPAPIFAGVHATSGSCARSSRLRFLLVTAAGLSKWGILRCLGRANNLSFIFTGNKSFGTSNNPTVTTNITRNKIIVVR